MGRFQNNSGAFFHVLTVVVDSDQALGNGGPFETVVQINELLIVGAHHSAGFVPDFEGVVDSGARWKVIAAAAGRQQGLPAHGDGRFDVDGLIGAAAGIVGLPEKDSDLVDHASAFGGNGELHPFWKLAFRRGFDHADIPFIGRYRP